MAPFNVVSMAPSRDGFNITPMGVAETLVGADDGGLPVAQFTSGWTISDDRLIWRMTLQAGATFHDGTLVTARWLSPVGTLDRSRRSQDSTVVAPAVAGACA
jgi:peptide/nickel transport system substrate-binding protein